MMVDDHGDVVVPSALAAPCGLSGVLGDADVQEPLDTTLFSPSTVLLNVYEVRDSAADKVSGCRRSSGSLLFGGIFHGGVEVYGMEWSYGAKGKDISGVSCIRPRSHPVHHYFATVRLGCTALNEAQTGSLVSRFTEAWPGDEYHVLHRNSLNFCNTLCEDLGVDTIPGWVDRVPRTASFIQTASSTAVEGARQTAELARSISVDVGGAMRTAAGALPVVEVDEATQRAVADGVATARQESKKALEAAKTESAKLAENAQAQAQALGSSLWRFGQDLQKAASDALAEEIQPAPARPSRRVEKSNGVSAVRMNHWDIGGLLGRTVEPGPLDKGRGEAQSWHHRTPLKRSPAPGSLHGDANAVDVADDKE